MRFLLALACLLLVAACGEVWNNPYPAGESGKNILYSSFSERPKHLDPAQAYTADEYDFIWQVYEPPLQYHYLERPYTLIPATAAAIPKPRYFSGAGTELPASAGDIAYSVYEIHIKPGIRYQPHPAFARDAAGRSLYLDLVPGDLRDKFRPADFPKNGSRELVAADYVYQIKRLAHPRIHSPILGHMSDYIVGLKEYAALLEQEDKVLQAGRPEGTPPAWTSLSKHEIAGVELVDRYTYRIKVRGKYPQFIYWLAMPFFAPVPPEADRFYAQAGMAEKNLSLDWYPVGTGPYMLSENNPNARMVLSRNPSFRGEAYPSEGEPEDAAAGLLADAGKIAPFIDSIVFTREKEGIPYWSKFMQGYYDQSGISNDNFDNAVRIGIEGEAALSPEMEGRGIRLKTSVATSVYYLSFNWLDPVVGGQGDAAGQERARKLRQAISIAVDNEEFISIFANGRGVPGQGPIPPGIFGFRGGDDGFNPVVYEKAGGTWRRKSIAQAKKLIAEAGYPNGRDVNTGVPLVLYLDTTGGGPGGKARLDWYRKQFQKIDVQLEFRTSDWNRFQEKIRKGNTQLFFLGWNADYPDPENFMFLLHGPQGAVKLGGENKANYSNPEFDRLFERMKNMDNGPERQGIIDRMVALLRQDAPWVWAYHPKDYSLYHAWLANVKPNQMARNGLKFYRLDTAQREARRAGWNRPVAWPMLLILLLLVLGTLPALRTWRARERARA
ncbi:MAG: peptide ABC transporter substrate-binding protein [Betaproteobacteria bacterium]|nr:MAG: peptide ABC transporter substrate-binding protein [Betaproteobacteria bacterium]